MHDFKVFEEWCKLHNIWIDSRLELKFDGSTGLSVFARDFIPSETTIVKIPKASILSNVTGTLGGLGLLSDGVDPQLNLAFTLLTEWLEGSSNPWWGYLQTLPWNDPPPLALLWDDPNGDIDGNEATSLIQGSDLARSLKSNGCILKDSITRFFTAEVEPMVGYRYPYLERDRRFALFKTAYALVSSRSFIVDAWHGPSMVPIADAFNHKEDYGVCLHTEFEVCRQCGALSRCKHDSPSSSPDSAAHLGPSEEVDTADMVTNRDHEAFEEIYNTYSHSIPLTNVQLLLQYGFMEEVNSADRVTFTPGEVEAILRQPLVGRFDDESFFIDSDGEPSPSLWKALSLVDWGRIEPTQSTITLKECRMEDVYCRLSQLCIARLQRLYAKGDVETIVTAIDSVPPSRCKTALAYRYVMNEALLLRACMERSHCN